ncbi:MAG: SDR family oxidoreductase [Parvularculaceae bacterium]
MKDLFSLEGRTALVTGGSRGIGEMIAEGLLAHGARVYVASRKADACEAAVARLLEATGAPADRCRALPADVSTVEGCDALAAAFGEREQALDILVNNAGAAWGEPFEAFPEAGWDKVMSLNVKTPFFLTKALHGRLKAAAREDRPSKAIMVASIDGLRINPWETYSYQASKAALIHLTRRMAARLIQDRICVSGIAPGAFASNMNKAARDHADMVAKVVPGGRVGAPSDMAGVAVFLASRAGDYVVGETIAVDGGMAHASFGHFGS